MSEGVWEHGLGFMAYVIRERLKTETKFLTEDERASLEALRVALTELKEPT